MRRSYLTALATVSLAALLSISSASQAVQSGIQFDGTLKPQDKWKVGIVNPDSGSFCAMVNKFDHHVGLAFALSPDGFGSVAIDLGQKAFEPGKDYTAILTTAGGDTEKVASHATSAQSVVMQVGRNDAFYDSLSKKPGLSIGLPALKVAFDLDKFSGGYKDLVGCAGSLTKAGSMPASPVKDVEKQALAAPLDRALDKISGEKTAGKSGAETASAAVTDANAIDAQVDADSKIADKTAAEKTADKIAVKAAAAAAAPVDASAETTASPVRKLLATVGDENVIPAATDTGADARRWDEEQASQMEQDRAAEKAREAAYLKQAMAEKDAQIAALKKEQDAKASQQLAAFKQQTKALDDKSADLQKQVAALEQANTAGATLKGSAAAAAQADIAEKQAEIAKVDAARDGKAREINMQLAQAAAQYQQQLGTLQGERDGMQKKLAQATADLTDARKTVQDDQARLSDLQQKLQTSQQEQQGLQTSLAALKAQNQKTEAALSAREKTLAEKEKSLSANAAEAKELAGVRADLQKLRGQHEATVADLQKELSAKDAQYAALKTQLDTMQKKTADVAALQEKLTKAQADAQKASTAAEQAAADRAAAAARATTAESKLADAQKEISGIRKSLVVVNDLPDPKVKKTQEALKAQQAAAAAAQAGLEASRQRVEALQQQLQASQQQLAALQQDAQKHATASTRQTAAVEQQKAALEKAQAEIASLREQNTQLSNHLASVTLEAPAQKQAAQTAAEKLAAAQKADDAAKKELAASRDRMTTLESQLNQSQQQIEKLTAAQKAATAAAAAKPAVEPVKQSEADIKHDNDALAAARAEIADLTAKNARLSQSLAAAALGADVPVKTAAAEKPVVAKETAPKLAVAAPESAAQQKIALMDAQAQIMKLKTEKLALQDKLQTQQEIAAAKPGINDIMWKTDMASAAPVTAAVPAAVKSAPAQVASADTMHGYTQTTRASLKGLTVEHREVPAAAAADAAASATPRPTLAQARASAQVQPAAGDASAEGFDSPDGSFNANRAEAFLDRIMSYHHVPGSKAQDVPMPKNAKPVFGGDDASSSGAATRTPLMSAHDQNEQAVQAQKTSAVASQDLAAPQGMMASHTQMPVASGEAVSLDRVLHQAGLADVRYVNSGNPASAGHMRQWTTGKLNGMVEQMPAGSFDTEVQSYIDRYRQDCAGQLKVSMGPVQNLSTGKLQQAVVACPVSSNSYDTSFVFLQDAKTFSAILHTGYPSDAARINNIGDNIAYMLGSAGSLDLAGGAAGHTAMAPAAPAPQGYANPMRLQPASMNNAGLDGVGVNSNGDLLPPVTEQQMPAPAQQPLQLRLNVPPATGYGAAQSPDDLQTVVVQ